MMTTTRGPRDVRTSGVPERSGGERSEPTQSAGTPERAIDSGEPAIGESEVLERPKRRQFTSEYKLRIVREAEACRESSAIGALLRREGLYASHLVTWRRQVKLGELKSLEPRARGRKAKKVDPLAKENEQLRREVARLKSDLAEAHVILDFQKKVAGILGVRLNRPPNVDAES